MHVTGNTSRSRVVRRIKPHQAEPSSFAEYAASFLTVCRVCYLVLEGAQSIVFGGLSICSGCALSDHSNTVSNHFRRALETGQQAKAAETLRTYKSNISPFIAYINNNVGSLDLLTGGHVIAYLGFMIERELAPATVRLALQSILSFLSSWSIDLSFSVDPVSVVDGYDRSSSYVPNKKDPILKSHFLQFMSRLDLTRMSVVQLRDILAVVFMRMGFLRVSELAPSKRNPGKGILFGDVTVNSPEQTTTVVIRLRKNTREKFSFIIPSMVFGSIPVFNMAQAFILQLRLSARMRNTSTDMAAVPFFQAVNHDRLTGDPFNLASRMPTILTQMGIPISEHKRFGTHSFRIGATTEAAEQGATMPQLQAAGGWRSSATASHYVRSSDVITSTIRRALSR